PASARPRCCEIEISTTQGPEPPASGRPTSVASRVPPGVASRRGDRAMLKVAYGLYAVVVYAFFFGTFLYAIAFVDDLPCAPKTIDSGTTGPLILALLIDALLLGLFAVQHSLMARPAFKRVWTKVVPPPIERSTYVLFASAALVAMYVFWQP